MAFSRLAIWLLEVLLVEASAKVAHDVIVTPWCSNSFRFQIRPSGSSKPKELPGALIDSCGPGVPSLLSQPVNHGNQQVEVQLDGQIVVRRVDTGAVLFKAVVDFEASQVVQGCLAVNLTTSPSSTAERVYGLGQGGWTDEGGARGGCASGSERVVPLERNGQTVNLLQTKFHVSVPFAYSSAGYGLLFNMPGYGSVIAGPKGVGGMSWRAEAVHELDFWVAVLPEGGETSTAAPIYEQYADATGHAPLLREDAMLFWQSRNRYKSSEIALSVAERYRQLNLPVGVLVIDYHNQAHDGDFAPDPRCYPSVRQLVQGVHKALNASTVFSFWPEAKSDSAEFGILKAAGCLINSDLGGRAIDATPKHCRELMWTQFLKPRYFDQGVTNYWLDETDGEGTAGGDGNHGYDTSYGPAAVATNLWVNDWISTFTEPVRAAGVEPLVLSRGVWAGGQRHGVVLWSSDIESTFEELAAQVPLGVHASLSGIPWWTSDVGGYGCGKEHDNNSTYMRELIVRWYQFGTFSPIFRTHGCRSGEADPAPKSNPCQGNLPSCGPNEVWSYGSETQVMLEKYIRLRADLKPYIAQLAKNVTAHGVPTMRPLWWEFPEDPLTLDINDEYLLGPDLLVAPVTKLGAVSRLIYFPKGAAWQNYFDSSDIREGGASIDVPAPLDTIPVFRRISSTRQWVADSPSLVI